MAPFRLNYAISKFFASKENKPYSNTRRSPILKIIFVSILFISINSICTTVKAQISQSQFINYQGIAADAEGKVLKNEDIAIQISLKFGSPDIAASYIEDHSVKTNAQGVFALKIGSGTPITGVYEELAWNGFAAFLSISINGKAVGTTELLAVPYAISSGDKQWYKNGDDIENLNSGKVGIDRNPTANLDVNGDLKLKNGIAVDEFSNDATLSGNSDLAVPTEKAVKVYVDNAVSQGPIVFKVRGKGYAVKQLPKTSIVEADIWEVKEFDTKNGFNMTTRRFVVPVTGYYYLHATVKQSNNATVENFKISFNVGANYGQYVMGYIYTEVSGLYYLTKNTEVYVNIQSYSTTRDHKIDGLYSYFEGFMVK